MVRKQPQLQLVQFRVCWLNAKSKSEAEKGADLGEEGGGEEAQSGPASCGWKWNAAQAGAGPFLPLSRSYQLLCCHLHKTTSSSVLERGPTEKRVFGEVFPAGMPLQLR